MWLFLAAHSAVVLVYIAACTPLTSPLPVVHHLPFSSPLLYNFSICIILLRSVPPVPCICSFITSHIYSPFPSPPPSISPSCYFSTVHPSLPPLFLHLFLLLFLLTRVSRSLLLSPSPLSAGCPVPSLSLGVADLLTA